MKRQSLAALRRLARKTADTLDRYAYALLDGRAHEVPTEALPLPTRLDWHGNPIRDTEPRAPLPGTPWQVIPTHAACRDAAAALRRNPDSIRNPWDSPAPPPSPENTVRDARILYGDNAAAVLRRQLETIDSDEYHGPAVRRWERALALLDAEDAAKDETSTD